ncbi:CHASE2 domain-containing protein [Pseudoduganella armeniaca]|uniref:Adenylate/guanylate cyclase domain-containing protein n=1 Tax=Pseudoduganella armeniaca TaxID=2072590 RepID=A0A2R4CFM2_9BURK|nr:adenylate/guanylate cyclase domain-containing protein [Pseudoduganella armeniaca]AVR98396.1 adenylate/guanylate cyclase domain-containing protein [Pseudoduganella armeniaca]
MTNPATARTNPAPALLLRGVVAAAVVLIGALPQLGDAPAPLRLGGEWLRDRFIQLAARELPDNRILVVDIDESSLAEQPWPWPRARLADLVEVLLQNGARGVALDILQEKPADAAGDARMAMLAAHGPVVLAQMFDYVRRGSPLHAGVLGGGVGAPSPAGAVPAHGFIGNHPGLAQSRHFGNIGVVPDPDGVLRRVPMYTWYAGRVYPTLSRALLECCASAAPPLGATGMARIPYTRSWESYDVAKAGDLLRGTVPPEFIRGRYVLVGSSSLSIGDRLATPLGASTAGLLVHAAMLGAQLDMLAGTAPAPWAGRAVAALFCVALALLASYTLPRLSAAVNALLLGALAAAWLGLAYLMAPHDALLEPGAPLLAIAFLLAVAVPMHWQLAQQRSRQLLGTLRQYVAKAVVDELLRSDLKDPLAPRLLQVTTLIADMQGYTTQVESLSLEQAARLTTDFLDCLTRPVLEKQGTLDKYTGDGLVAFWGAPLPNEQHADLALDAAAGILREVARFSQLRAAQGLPPLRVRIGIESGPAMAGDYGTSFRSIYTAVGDSVNTASRLEQAARDYPHDVIVGEGTVALSQRHRFLPLGERTLRGKERPIKVYTLAEAA